ncbi:hypothetical protein [Bifidobacterium favimelis]|uniref:Uncharacterized protein n=1 Tax=Bifidobacterium favimelis TaxID=3122979 RepID=A0ABU8ZLZ9_9BIFI
MPDSVKPGSEQTRIKQAGATGALVQVFCYILLALPALLTMGPLSGLGGLWTYVIEGVLLLAAVLVWWPFSAPGAKDLPDRVICGLLGVAALVSSYVMQYGRINALRDGTLTGGSGWEALRGWLEAAAGLLAILAVVMFLRQMARVNHRTQVIRGLSLTAFGGLACICAAGWTFLPWLAAASVTVVGEGKGLILALTLLVALAVVVALGWSGVQWVRQAAASGQPAAARTFGLALLPVMLSGAVIVLTLFVLHFVI